MLFRSTLSAATLDKVVDYCGLKPSSYEKRKVSETDPVDIYREVKNAYLMWNRPKKMYIDFTGDEAGALAGALRDCRKITAFFLGGEESSWVKKSGS